MGHALKRDGGEDEEARQWPVDARTDVLVDVADVDVCHHERKCGHDFVDAFD